MKKVAAILVTYNRVDLLKKMSFPAVDSAGCVNTNSGD
ncbi:hypothetical protein NAB2_1277 [Lactiplantibacillus plantarum]|uniref:Uncharacterized protein n=1 Tax=Lactiplantibacillus plantarum TaxID=1590 RepID=A0AAW3RHR6_LACPN|nr:hypothetical protein NAB2_1277 [Lactiplantibacillus plantarum]